MVIAAVMVLADVGASSQTTGRRAAACAVGTVKASIEGSVVCLKSGRECVSRLDTDYQRLGFDCIAGVLIRRSGWVITELGSPWVPVAINERGQVVGDFGRGFMGYTTPPDWRAVLWQNGQITFLAPPGYGHAQAINDAGQIIGWNTTRAGVRQNFTWRDGVRTDLGALHPIGLNESGQVAGNSQASSGAYNPGDASHLDASLWNDGTLTTLNIPTDATSTVADDTSEVINARGQVLMNGGDGTTRGWKVWENGVLTDIDGPGVTHAVAINESGQILLRGANRKGTQGFLWERGILRNIGTLGGRETNPRAINDRGQIVGQSQTKNGSYHAFLWANGKMRDLGTLGGQVSGAVAINNRGQVVGTSLTKRPGNLHAFLWQNGRLRDLSPLTTVNRSVAPAINDRGQIVGTISRTIGGNRFLHTEAAVMWTVPSGP